jgi:hypothetical protein
LECLRKDKKTNWQGDTPFLEKLSKTDQLLLGGLTKDKSGTGLFEGGF